MLSDYNTSNNQGFPSDDNEHFWPGGSYLSGSTCEGGMSTSMNSGLVNQYFIVGEDPGIPSTLGLTPPPMAVVMDGDGTFACAADGFAGEPCNLDALGLNCTYHLPATAGWLTPAMYGPRWGCPHESLSTPSPPCCRPAPRYRCRFSYRPAPRCRPPDHTCALNVLTRLLASRLKRTYAATSELCMQQGANRSTAAGVRRLV